MPPFETIDLIHWLAAGKPVKDGMMVHPKDLVDQKVKEDKEKQSKFRYVKRSGADPHPPIITNDNPPRVVQPQPHFFPVPAPFHPQVGAAPLLEGTYARHQIPAPYPPLQYAYPHPYSIAAMNPGQTYGVPQGYYAYPMMAYAPVPVAAEKKKKDKKDKKVTFNPHNWYGRTAVEVQYDDAVKANKGGANEPKDIKPDGAKPGDEFWVVDTDGSRYLRSYYEIENVHRPGKWFIAPAGNLCFQKSKEESSSDSDSD
ncbi:hypothetical protein NA57DRAFT_78901 [Rhizodiscina lignyota]|uniref:Uncharacterized protein n=1 Tax=Rhizodiscina lignyota TaxID=1504668 RepID=A0A9P4IB35_9PEZI|nr:hypothetical protein NA57DRAFT_78901 [Rhizodiscina lignyota]